MIFTNRSTYGCAGFLFLVLLGAVFGPNKTERSPGGSPARVTVDQHLAKADCVHFVRKRLPRAATFSGAMVSGSGMGPWTVSGYVDYGTTRAYACVVTYEDKGLRVRLMSLEM